MIILMTHDQVLVISRIERMMFICLGIMVVAFFEYLTSAKPTWLITSITGIIGQFLVLKCWLDMIYMSEPYKNCWAFKG